jgi:hypothetical protein
MSALTADQVTTIIEALEDRQRFANDHLSELNANPAYRAERLGLYDDMVELQSECATLLALLSGASSVEVTA